MTAEELRSRVYHNVGTMLQRTNEIRCAEGVIYDEGDAMLVSHCSHTFEVEHVRVGITEGLGIHHLGVGLDSSIEGFEIVHVNNGIRNTLRSQCVGNQVVGTTIEVVGSDDVIAVLHDILQRISDGSSTTGHSQTCHTTLKGSDAILEHTLSGVGETTTCVGSGVSLFLAYMEL